jgi:hypothetical protein
LFINGAGAARGRVIVVRYADDFVMASRTRPNPQERHDRSGEHGDPVGKVLIGRENRQLPRPVAAWRKPARVSPGRPDLVAKTVAALDPNAQSVHAATHADI